jgi:rhamnose utilization protein RhaD (predicted bifunctional aldolase and dehydrogenase)
VAPPARPDGPLAELAALSAALGRDSEQVQAAGGNTSLKAGGVLWVKASGLWLADALHRDVFVPVRLEPVLAAVAAGVPDPVGPSVLAEANPGGLRPSIETTLHALLPQAVVVHTHSVRALALTVREDAEARLAERLGGLAWAFLPYLQPGLPLTLALAERLGAGPVDVILLGNHGLVVAAPTAASARALLAEVERRLDAPVLPTPPLGPDAASTLTRLADALRLRPARHARAHDLAADPHRLARATAGSLYPDHVIFLGPGAATLPADPSAGPAAVASALEAGRKLLLAPGAGALLAPGTGESADELALCLALALERVPDDAHLRYLGPEDEAALLDLDAEKYRQGLAKTRAVSGD